MQDPEFQLPMHSLATGTGLEWHFEVPSLTQPLCYLSAGAMVFPYQSPPWCLSTSHALKQLREEAAVNYNMELLVNKEHCVCRGLQSTDNVATREDAAKALPADQCKGIFNTKIPGPNCHPDDKSQSVMSTKLMNANWCPTGQSTPCCSIPAIDNWAEACCSKIERVVGKPCEVPAASIVGATTPELPHWHDNLSTAQVPDGEYAYTCCSPINYDMPADKWATAWIYGSAGCVPKLWVEMPAALARTDKLIIDSRTTHRGGGCPPALD